MASAPRCGREPWAATPVTVTSVQQNPRWPVPTWPLGGLGDDRGVDGAGVEVGQHLLDAEAGLLLVGDGGDHDLAVDARAGRVPAGDEGGGETGLHVVGAAGVEPVTVDARHEGVLRARQADRVEVAAQQEPSPAGVATAADDDAGPARRPLDDSGRRGRPLVAHAATNAATSASPAAPGRALG